MSWTAILGLVAALLVGLYWGRPLRYGQSQSEIEKRLGEEGEHGKVKRRATFLTILARSVERGSDRRRREARRRPFQMGDRKRR